MAQLTFGDVSVDMRLDAADYGIPDLQAFEAFLTDFNPVASQELSSSNTVYRVRYWDAQYRTATLTYEGNFAAYSVTRMEIIANGIKSEANGNFHIDPYSGYVYGTLTSASARYAADNGLITSLAGVSIAIDLSYDSGIALADSTVLAGNDTISSGTGDDYLLGYSGNDALSGGGGDDTLDGSGGADTMAGGPGNDTYRVDNSGDVVIEAQDAGTDTVISRVTYSLPANGENLTLAGSAGIAGTGNGAANLITGNDGDNTLNGGPGADTLTGGAGNDTYILADLDVVNEAPGGGTDTVKAAISYTLAANLENLTLTGSADLTGKGNALANLITGNRGANRLVGLDGADRLAGMAGDDTLLGGTGKDTLNGGAGADSMVGGSGNDVYLVDSAGDQVVEGRNAGIDLVRAWVSHSLAGNVEDLVLEGTDPLNGTGNGLANRLTGNDADNLLSGGPGYDTLNGRGGMDVLTGGKGADSFVFDTPLAAGSNVDTITDFSPGVDTLVLDSTAFTAVGDLGAMTDGDGRFRAAPGATAGQDADDRLVYDSATGALYYDADGAGAGAAIQFAQIGVDTHPSLSAADFTIV